MVIRYKAEMTLINSTSSSSLAVAEGGKILKRGEKEISCSGTSYLPTPKQFMFSGTDNGMVNLKATTLFSLQRFSYHLELLNHYPTLSEANSENTTPSFDN